MAIFAARCDGGRIPRAESAFPDTPRTMRRQTKVQVLAVLGLCISMYALTVESHLDDDEYEAVHDTLAEMSHIASYSSSSR